MQRYIFFIKQPSLNKIFLRIAFEMAVLCGFWCDIGLVKYVKLSVYVANICLWLPLFCINVGMCLLAREAWQSQLAMGTLYSDKYDVLRCVSN